MRWGEEEMLNVGWRFVIMAMMTYMKGSVRRISCFRTDRGKMENMKFMDNENTHSPRISSKDLN